MARMGTHTRRTAARHPVSLRTVALILTEIGRRQRAGLMPIADGRVGFGASDEECIASPRQSPRG
jgi:hypothetical protein